MRMFICFLSLLRLPDCPINASLMGMDVSWHGIDLGKNITKVRDPMMEFFETETLLPVSQPSSQFSQDNTHYELKMRVEGTVIHTVRLLRQSSCFCLFPSCLDPRFSSPEFSM